MYKLNIELQQHTPLLHFQHSQDGATLRATEVKPKLDRFLIEKVYEDNFEKYKHSLQSYNGEPKHKVKHLALAYKLRFKVGQIKIFDNSNLAGYFAELGNKGEVGKKLSFAENIQMQIVCSNPKLLNDIKQNIASFFIHHNFGTRQSRGFGSFTITAEEPIKLDYNFEIKENRNEQPHSWENLFQHIDLFARSLRAGFNLKGRDKKTTFYFKSLAFVYAKKVLGVQWDKKTVKENFFINDLRKQQEIHNNADNVSYSGKKLLIKDLFGLSTAESWRSYRSMVEKKSETVQRFQSPILFKPISDSNGNFTVHIKANDIPKEMLNRNFDISTRGKRSFNIRTPENFSVKEFLDFTFKNFDISKHVNSEYHRRKEYQILKTIYEQLKK